MISLINFSHFQLVFFTIIFSTLSQISPQPSPYGFKIQYIGKPHYVSPNHEKFGNFCTSIQCISDADILFTRSSQYKASDPCVDFANFTLGTAMEIGPPNDRNAQRGFQKDIEDKLAEGMRRVLSEKIHENDEKIVKNVKKMFKVFLKSDHALRHIEGHKTFVEYLRFLGGSPYLSKHLAWNPFWFDKSKDFGFLMPKNSSALDLDLWDEKKFSLQKLIENEAENFLKYFFDLQLMRCKNGKSEILCLETFEYISGFKTIPTAYKAAFEDTDQLYSMLRIMNDYFTAGFYGKIELDEKIFKPAMENFKEFLNSRRKILKSFKEFKPQIIKIKELKNIFNIDWLKLINLQLFEVYQVNEEEEILVKDVNMLGMLAKNLFEMPKRYYTYTQI